MAKKFSTAVADIVDNLPHGDPLACLVSIAPPSHRRVCRGAGDIVLVSLPSFSFLALVRLVPLLVLLVGKRGVAGGLLSCVVR